MYPPTQKLAFSGVPVKIFWSFARCGGLFRDQGRGLLSSSCQGAVAEGRSWSRPTEVLSVWVDPGSRSSRWGGILRSDAVSCTTPRTPKGVGVELPDKKQGQHENSAEDDDASSTTSSSSESSRRVPLRQLLWFFKLELESRERTLEDRPDDTSVTKGTNKRKVSRLLFDGGSKRTFITETCSRTLGCKLLGTEALSVGVLVGTYSQRTFRRVEVFLVCTDSDKVYKIEAPETPSICEQVIPCPTEEIRATLLELSLPLGDDSPQGENLRIEVLVGSDHFWVFLTGKVKRLNSASTAMETVFGRAVQGWTSTRCPRISCSHAVVLRKSAVDRETAPMLWSFWELESIGVSHSLEINPDERSVEEFSNSIRSSNGRYEVRLPWKEEVELADNRVVAEKRLRQLTKRLLRAPSLLHEYDNEMRRL
ncbi:hypothetical protein HPB49_012990 [Dermacentor silvarum]|uniref:Uncharacterized protein n=1 Tax=Dermacentor silvarum TaxID=543639 RepID=A0ACB8CL20_DERSI|nr:hypothetical protein HPB49_012990 [Dermacentor silvarum]